MLDIRNRTPFTVGLFPGLDKESYDDATVVVKGTFDLRSRGGEPALSEEQIPLVLGDQFHGDPATSSIRLASDTSPLKQGTDVVLVGRAYPRRKAPVTDVALVAGPLRKSLRVFGDRTWRRAAGGYAPTDPVPFETMPLVYERAFGGSDTTDPDPANHACERRNPVGVGLIAPGRTTEIEGTPLPNLEDAARLVGGPRDLVAPVGFGFIGRSWMPRVGFAGTYDERWRAQRCPLLPADFDDRYHSAAHPDLIAPRHFTGGEPVRVTNASPDGEIDTVVPTRALSVAVRIKGKTASHPLLLDTLLLEPDAGRLVVVWRATFRCPKTFLFIEHLTVTEGSRG